MDPIEQIDRLEKYMYMYIDLLPNLWEYGGHRVQNRELLPTFEYYNKVYNDPAYSLSIPHYCDSQIRRYSVTAGGLSVKDLIHYADSIGVIPLTNDKDRVELRYVDNPEKGYLPDDQAVNIRPYNIWLGCKFYTN